MGRLTEREIFNCLTENFRLAADHCVELAKRTRRGPIYTRLREELKLIEGCCRQASAWREDTRWLNIAHVAAEAHRLAGEWLRGVKVGNGPRRKVPEGELHPMFMQLGDWLRARHAEAIALRDRATGRVGMILPIVREGPLRESRQHRVELPPGMTYRPSGLIVPLDNAA